MSNSVIHCETWRGNALLNNLRVLSCEIAVFSQITLVITRWAKSPRLFLPSVVPVLRERQSFHCSTDLGCPFWRKSSFSSQSVSPSGPKVWSWRKGLQNSSHIYNNDNSDSDSDGTCEAMRIKLLLKTKSRNKIWQKGRFPEKNRFSFFFDGIWIWALNFFPCYSKIMELK